MHFSVAQSKKNHEDALQAVRGGIGARLLELGFSRKSARLYVREDERFREWVRFSYSGLSTFSDLLGIYDKELAALTTSCPLSRGSDFGLTDPRPAHVLHNAQTAWRDWENALENDWRETLDWWNPVDWARRAPRRESKASDFVGERGKWKTNGDPEACAAESLRIWRKHVEPWRQRMLTSRHFLFGQLIYTTIPLRDDSRILLNFYVGQIADAERICRRVLAEVQAQLTALESGKICEPCASANVTSDRLPPSYLENVMRKRERIQHIISTLGLNA